MHFSQSCYQNSNVFLKSMFKIMSTIPSFPPHAGVYFEEIVGFMIKKYNFYHKKSLFIYTRCIFLSTQTHFFHFKGDSNLKPYQFSMMQLIKQWDKLWTKLNLKNSGLTLFFKEKTIQ